MKINKTKLITLLFIIINWIGCRDQPTCIPEQTDLMKLVFVDESGTVTPIEVTQFLIDDMIGLIDTSFSSITIPLNPADSIMSLIFYQPEDTNKLVISYRSTPIVLHPECMLETKFDFLKIDSTTFLNTIIVDPLLSLESTQNVQVAH